jgi:hypothetical protein
MYVARAFPGGWAVINTRTDQFAFIGVIELSGLERAVAEAMAKALGDGSDSDDGPPIGSGRGRRAVDGTAST